MRTPPPNQFETQLFLQDHRCAWECVGDQTADEPVVWSRGFAFRGQQFFDGKDLARHVQRKAVEGTGKLRAEIEQLNGGWAVVAQLADGQLLAAVDRMRSIPLFYFFDGRSLAIATTADGLALRFAKSPNVRNQIEFLLFMYVTGRDTLYDDVKQLQPGELLLFQPGLSEPLTITRYFRFYPTEIASDSAEALSEQLAYVLRRMFERHHEGMRGRRVVIPLSGGLDSRLVAGMLKRVGVDDCFCYTYGDPADEETENSRQVAEALGFEWRLLPYTPELCARWNGSDVLPLFMRYGCKGVSLPSPHDYPAVMQLAEEGHCGEDVVFFPGHTGDMISGGHIPRDYRDISSGTLTPTAHVLRSHGRALWDDPEPLLSLPPVRGLLEKIDSLAAVPAGAAYRDEVACCDMWNAEQRQSKYIINSVRTYEFVGSRWRTLWDSEFMDFFLRVPIELRYGQRLYLECLRDKIFVGDLARLAKIPLTKLGPLDAILSARGRETTSRFGKAIQSIKRQTRLQLLKAGLARRHLKSVPHSLLPRVRLAGLGMPDSSISLHDALKSVGISELLSPEIQEYLRPMLGYRLESLRFRTVYAVLVFAEMSRNLSARP